MYGKPVENQVRRVLDTFLNIKKIFDEIFKHEKFEL